MLNLENQWDRISGRDYNHLPGGLNVFYKFLENNPNDDCDCQGSETRNRIRMFKTSSTFMLSVSKNKRKFDEHSTRKGILVCINIQIVLQDSTVPCPPADQNWFGKSLSRIHEGSYSKKTVGE